MTLLRCKNLAHLMMLACSCFVLASPVQAAISWDGEGGSSWFFDPNNWTSDDDEDILPPGNLVAGDNIERTDLQINDGYEVIFDPVNDPNWANAASLRYPINNDAPGSGGDYGVIGDPADMRFDVYRFYMSRNTTESNTFVLKSGTLTAERTIVGRSGSQAGMPNQGTFIQEGGVLSIPREDLIIGAYESIEGGIPGGGGNGTYEYHSGSLEVGIDFNEGVFEILVGSESNSEGGTSGVSKFVVHNPGDAAGGHIIAQEFHTSSGDLNANGVDSGVAIVEFHYSNGGVRTVQVETVLGINNGVSDNGTRSSRLDLQLDEAVEVDGMGVPGNLGLFHVGVDGFDFVGQITGGGDEGGMFSNADNTELYEQDSSVKAFYGGYEYEWQISYEGLITFDENDYNDDINGYQNSIVESVEAEGASDVVLIGVGSTFVGLTGDYNENGVVDAADFTVWRDTLNTSVTAGTGADGDGDGMITEADYDLWVAYFGQTVVPPVMASAATAVPEPASALLVLLACGAAAGRRRR
ncbi:hypothetical protein Mal64_33150 [Pseudobythopirellula maris]|uniref:PEP-CTERM protein-sorting domain-containing protein n=1 Tax=Pseudobythopirellula maris TaxID=2527991 RepID=A0A5C5ZH93_9BACT|nr:PEP-CTERM sorting domain-containing protein [Pseudobythopirellula maris]TWT86490.1 hypothetical protein Mal64_33150 [Pseudobythopirellula maris]